ncbi:MAG: hypothetical protein NT013_03235 [Planctomycetia bacterium]|nr:hypothetical protein [Planctomycetia bacterium]
MPVTRSVSEGNYIIIVADCSGSDKDVGDVVTDLVIDIRESLGLVFNNITKPFEISGR